MGNHLYSFDLSENDLRKVFNYWYRVSDKAIPYSKKHVEWIKENCNGDYLFHGGHWFLKEEEDAVAFKLKWL